MLIVLLAIAVLVAIPVGVQYALDPAENIVVESRRDIAKTLEVAIIEVLDKSPGYIPPERKLIDLFRRLFLELWSAFKDGLSSKRR